MSTTSGTSILDQRNSKATSEKWGGDIFTYNIANAMNEYDTDLAKYNTSKTKATNITNELKNTDLTEDEKKSLNGELAGLNETMSTLNNKYDGDITKYDINTLYSDYTKDLQYVNYVDSLENAKNSTINQARKDETQKIQYADTRNALMQKYIPETLMAQGIANTGYTADALLKAENKYNQYVIDAISERSKLETDAMQKYQDAAAEFKLAQDEQAYNEFLAKQEKAKAEEEEQRAMYTTMIDLIDTGYISAEKNAAIPYDAAIARLKAAGASEETIQNFTKYFDKVFGTTNGKGGDNGNSSTPPKDPVIEDAPIEEGQAKQHTFSVNNNVYSGGYVPYNHTYEQKGNSGAFIKQTQDDGSVVYAGPLVATAKNTSDSLRVDPKMSSFNWDKIEGGTAGEGSNAASGKFDYNGTTYKVEIEMPCMNEEFSNKAKMILGDGYLDHSVFMYNNKIYLVGTSKYNNGAYQIWALKDDDDLADDILKVLTKSSIPDAEARTT